VLAGTISDQAELYGVLAEIEALGSSCSKSAACRRDDRSRVSELKEGGSLNPARVDSQISISSGTSGKPHPRGWRSHPRRV
jgi:hypothetical protein